MTNILTKSEASEFLTKDDLEKLEQAIQQGTLKSEIDSGLFIIVRKKKINLFDVLELMGGF